MFKNNTRGFTVASNDFLNDRNLSWKAKGIYMYLKSKPTGWDFAISRISCDSTDGVTATTAGIIELEKSGLLSRTKLSSGKAEYEIFDYSEPNPTQGKPNSRKPQVGETLTISNKEEKVNKEEKGEREETAPARELPKEETSEDLSPELPPEPFTPFKHFLEAKADPTWVDEQRAWEEVWEELRAKSKTGRLVEAIKWATENDICLVGPPESFIDGAWRQIWGDFMQTGVFLAGISQNKVIARPASFTADFKPFLDSKTGGTWIAQLQRWKGEWGKLISLAECNLAEVFEWATENYLGGISSSGYFVEDTWPKILAAFLRDLNSPKAKSGSCAIMRTGLEKYPPRPEGLFKPKDEV